MKEVSVTVTVGIGSEKHNHDLEYRSTLEHVHSRPEGVIELVPYQPYQERINEALKPFIDEYNEKQQERYQLAWDRYNSGQTKTKPRKRDYKPMGYDYYSDHLHDLHRNPRTKKVEELPMWRSIIIGIGDKEDRQLGNITEKQARKIMKEVVDKFAEDFPDFIILGATLHLDEKGFYHMHLDFKPLYEKEKTEKGLSVGVGLDTALKRMGYEPEQSIINGRDKVPLLFNRMRNVIYYNVEEALAREGLRLQYGVSEVKEPGKDSSRNQSLEVWQDIQDKARSMQHSKNIVLDILANDSVTVDEEKELAEAYDGIERALAEINNAPRSRFDKSKGVVSFKIFDQLKSFINHLLKALVHIKNERDEYKKENIELKQQLQEKAFDDKLSRTEARRDLSGFQNLEKKIEKE